MNKGKFIGYDDECRYLWEFGKCDNICVRDCIDIGYILIWMCFMILIVY